VLPGVLLLPSVAVPQFGKAGEQLFGFALGLSGVVDWAKAAPALVSTMSVASVGIFIAPFSIVTVHRVHQFSTNGVRKKALRIVC